MRARRVARHGVVPVVLVLVGVLLGGSVAAFAPRSSTATATAFVSSREAGSVQDLVWRGESAERSTESYAEIASAPLVLDPVISALDLEVGKEDLASRVAVTVPDGTTTLVVAARDRSPARAAAIANAIVRRLATSVRDLAPARGGTQTPQIVLLRAATPPSTSAPEGLGRDLLFGGGVGLLLAGVWLALRFRRPGPPRWGSPSTSLGG